MKIDNKLILSTIFFLYTSSNILLASMSEPKKNNKRNYKESDVNRRINSTGWTLLHEAVNRADKNRVKELLETGALILKDYKNNFAYHVPIIENYREIQCKTHTADLLKEYHAAILMLREYEDQGHFISCYSWPKEQDILANPNATETETTYNLSPLHLAVIYADLPMAKALLYHGALITKNQHGYLPQDMILYSKYKDNSKKIKIYDDTKQLIIKRFAEQTAAAVKIQKLFRKIKIKSIDSNTLKPKECSEDPDAIIYLKYSETGKYHSLEPKERSEDSDGIIYLKYSETVKYHSLEPGEDPGDIKFFQYSESGHEDSSEKFEKKPSKSLDTIKIFQTSKSEQELSEYSV